jgi:hypothetical protein
MKDQPTPPRPSTGAAHDAAGPSDRAFGLTFAGVSVVAGFLPLARGGEVRVWALLAAAVFAVFFVVITPVALLMRLVRRRPLATGFDRGAASYWIQRDPPGPEPETMTRQF